MEICQWCLSPQHFAYTKVSSNYTRGKYNDFSLLLCKQCNHITTHPILDSSSLNELYLVDYQYSVHETIGSEKVFRAGQLLRNELAPWLHQGTLIDFGCGDGSLVSEARKLGFTATGVDLHPPTYHNSSETYHQQDLLSFAQCEQDRKFDIAVFSHSLEHVSDPVLLLQSVRVNIINSNGFVVIVVPNHEARTKKILKRWWGYWQVPVHINHFSFGSLKKVCESAGYQVIHKNIRGADSLFWILSLGNLLKIKQAKQTSKLQLRFLKIFSFIAKYWIFIGSEDLIVIIRPSKF